MKPTTTNLQIPRISLILMIMLVLLAPYAMSFPPHSEAWDAANNRDSLGIQRVVLVIFGLSTTLLSFGQLLHSLKKASEDAIGIASSASIFLACAVVGWRSFPYWANGVYQVYAGHFPMRDLDPKSLIPMEWIGDLWRMPVLLLYVLCFLAVPVLTVAAVLGFWKKRFVPAIVTIVSVGVAVFFIFQFSPAYIEWLMD